MIFLFFIINSIMRLYNLFEFEDLLLLEDLKPSKNTYYDLLINPDIDIKLPLFKQDFINDKKKLYYYIRQVEYHINCLRNDIIKFLKGNKLIKSIKSNNSFTNTQNGYKSLSVYIDFVLKNGNTGKIRISDHHKTRTQDEGKNIFKMWYGSWLSDNNKNKINNYILNRYNSGNDYKDNNEEISNTTNDKIKDVKIPEVVYLNRKKIQKSS